MAVRLVIGRAGTGKTALCVREIRAAMADDPLGPPLLWLTPEQGTFGAERLLLAGDDAGHSFVARAPEAQAPGIRRADDSLKAVLPTRGTFRAQVLSLRRLALMIARDVGLLEGGPERAGKPMDEVARVVLLEEMLRQEGARLTVFASIADRPGFVKKLDATLRELRQHGHSGASLRALLDGPPAGIDVVMRRKLLDLAVLLEAWSKVVEKPDAWDYEYLMHQAALQMGASPMIAGARVWVDALSALSALEMRMLAGLGLHARELTITLLADPDAPAMRTLRCAADSTEGWGLFARTERLHRRLIDVFRRHGVALGQTVALRRGHRFADAAVGRVEAELLEEGVRGEGMLFDTHARGEAERDAGDDRLKAVLQTFRMGVEIWESSDPETEVRMAAQAIREMAVAGGPGALRYRQIAVIVPELDDGGGAGGGYQDAIRRIFAEHHIPHFIDARRSMAHHPLVELVRSAVAVATSHFDRDEMLLLLKTQLVGINDDDVALVENYAIEHGISRAPWDQPWTWVAPNQREEEADQWVPASAHERLARANEIRVRVWDALRAFVESLNDDEAPNQAPANAAPNDGARFARALRQLLVTLQVEGQIKNWMDAARAQGDAELAQVHEQVWREINQLLTLLETLLADRQRTLPEFERLLATALQSLTLGLIPPTVDQVLVSSVTRSRVPEMEVVLVLGAVEGQFPKVVEEDSILSDAQREEFNACAADPIGEGSDRQLLEMPFFDYVAFTRARRRLIVSYSLADRQGKALGRSRHVTRLRELLGPAIVERQFDAASRTRIDRIATADDLLAGVTSWARRAYMLSGHSNRLTQGEGPGAPLSMAHDDDLMPAVYNWLVTQAPAEIAAARRQVWGCVGERRAPQLAEALAARFYPPGEPLRMSVSQLERFAACPLQYFVHYTLGLRPRAEFQLDQLSLGQLQHRILERVYRRIMKGDIAWPSCAEAKVRALLADEVDGTIEELHAEISRRTPGYDKTRQRLKRVLGVMLEGDRRRAALGKIKPVAVELVFGKGAAPPQDGGKLIRLPVLPVPTPEKRLVHVSGKIDRMDVPDSAAPQAIVIDYKSAARKSMDLFRVLSGIALQLPVYALVMKELAQHDPIAALYISLGLHRETLAHEKEAIAAGTDAFYQQFKPRGLIDAAHAAQLDPQLPAEGAATSPWYKLTFNKDGAPRKGTDLLAHEDFQTLLSFTAWIIAALGDELAAGKIAPEPYRVGTETPCAYCDYASLCPFDQARGAYRQVRRAPNDALFEQMRQKMNR